MPLLGILAVMADVVCCLHAVRNGKDRYWIFIILAFPGLGALIYFVAEMLSDLPHTMAAHKVRRAGSEIARSMNPDKLIRQLSEELQVTDSLENRRRLARAYQEISRHDEALEIYERCINGPHGAEPELMLEYARGLFLAGRYAPAREVLQGLSGGMMERRRAERDFLLALISEKIGNVREAMEQYAVLERSMPGEEVRCRYAMLLLENGEPARAKELFDKILFNARRSPRYYRKVQRPWIETARRYARTVQ
ncbi:MAG: tetratricopeptide repeat protein [Thermodesulfobacteriota bacterium]